jgi:hypothetical protein
VEQEHTVRDGGSQVDFRTLLPRLTAGIRSLDPGDPRARRLPSGLALTADGWEAELVSPPVSAAAVGYRELETVLARGRDELLRELGRCVDRPALDGFSTHLNVSVPDDEVVRIGWEFARRCAPAVMGITERDESPGMLVRPRRGRLEVCSEFVDGESLVQAVDVVVACAAGLLRGDLPPVVIDDPMPAREKFGWFIAGGARADLSGWVSEQPVGLATEPEHLVTHAVPRSVDGIDAETLWLTWTHVVWSLTDLDRGRSVYAVLRTEQEREFLDALASGALTGLVRRAMSRLGPRRRLLVHADADPAAVWHDVRPGALVPAERSRDGSVPAVDRRAARADLSRTRRQHRR